MGEVFISKSSKKGGTVPIGSLKPGQIVYLKKDNKDTPFIVWQVGKPQFTFFSSNESSNVNIKSYDIYDDSCDGVFLVQKDIDALVPLDSKTSLYAKSSIKSYLDTTYYNSFSSRVKSAIKRVKIPYASGYSYDGWNNPNIAQYTIQIKGNGLECYCFLPSITEFSLKFLVNVVYLSFYSAVFDNLTEIDDYAALQGETTTSEATFGVPDGLNMQYPSLIGDRYVGEIYDNNSFDYNWVLANMASQYYCPAKYNGELTNYWTRSIGVNHKTDVTFLPRCINSKINYAKENDSQYVLYPTEYQNSGENCYYSTVSPSNKTIGIRPMFVVGKDFTGYKLPTEDQADAMAYGDAIALTTQSDVIITTDDKDTLEQAYNIIIGGKE